MACIEAAITDHFKVFFRDVPDQTSDEIHSRKCFFNIGIILMTVVMESNVFTIVVINAGYRDDRPSKVTANIEDHGLPEKSDAGSIYSKNAVSVLDVNEFEGHLSSSFHGIFITTGRAETAVAPERDIFEITAVGTAKHGTAKRRVATVDHFVDIFKLTFTRVECIFNFIIIIIENFL